MDQSTRDVQQDRERARTAITEKIELLEESVRNRVEGAKTAVKRNFDLRYHVHQRPWQMFGLSIMAGYFIGRMVSDRSAGWTRREHAMAQQIGSGDTAAVASAVGDDLYTPPIAQRAQKSSWGVLDQFHDEIETLKGAAIAAVVSVVRDLLKTAAASVKDSATALTDQSRSPTERGHGGI